MNRYVSNKKNIELQEELTLNPEENDQAAFESNEKMTTLKLDQNIVPGFAEEKKPKTQFRLNA